jgi:hypothetical protein
MATLWKIEIAVVLGLLAFIASAGTTTVNRTMKLALSGGFLIMALINAEAQIKVAEQRRALVDYFRALNPPVLADSSGWIDPLYVTPVIRVVCLHAAIIVLVVLFIWFYSPRKSGS